MKYVILFLLAGIVGCASAPKQPNPFLCIHPAIMGGAPFQMPEDAVWLNNGKVRFTMQGKDITLVGVICIKVEGGI